jgi:hypothetical protein
MYPIRMQFSEYPFDLGYCNCTDRDINDIFLGKGFTDWAVGTAVKHFEFRVFTHHINDLTYDVFGTGKTIAR